MRNRQFVLSETEVNELKCAFHNCEEGQTKIRYQAVRLYGQGHPVNEIESICGCSRSSLMEWCRAYRQDGIAGLVDKRQGGNHRQDGASFRSR
ncbi:MAG: helix-turn-helix domain-containing protein [Nitrospira sp.]|nr:helix-turn-helix domain-containing protein [Nitrospira sp.]